MPASDQPIGPPQPPPWTPGDLLPVQYGVTEPDLSGVKIETTAKGMAVVTVRVYGSVTEQEMQDRKDLAIRTYETAIRELGQRAEFQ